MSLPDVQDLKAFLQIIHREVEAYLPEPLATIFLAAVPVGLVLWIFWWGAGPMVRDLMGFRRKGK